MNTIKNCSTLYLPISTSWTSWIFRAFAISSWFLAGSKPLASDLDLWPTFSQGGCLYLCLYLSNCLVSWLQSDRSSMSCLLCRNPTALGWVAQPRSLGRSMVLGGLLVLNCLFGCWPLACSWVDVVRLVGAFGIVFAIIFLSDSRCNLFLRGRMTTHPYQTSTRIACAHRRMI